MRPSVVLDMKRSAVCEAVGPFAPRTRASLLGAAWHRVGMAQRPDLLVDALPGAVVGLGRFGRRRTGNRCSALVADLLTPGDLPPVPGQRARGGATDMSENRRLITRPHSAGRNRCACQEGMAMTTLGRTSAPSRPSS